MLWSKYIFRFMDHKEDIKSPSHYALCLCMEGPWGTQYFLLTEKGKKKEQCRFFDTIRIEVMPQMVQCVFLCCSMLQSESCSELCEAMQCAVVCCSVLQCTVIMMRMNEYF